MITYKHGSLFSVQSGIIVHGCNTKGVMGSGVAKEFKKRFPDAFYQYQKDTGLLALGDNSYHKHEKLMLVSALTQKDFGREAIRYVSYDAVDTCFRSLKSVIDTMPDWFGDVDRSCIHIPKIGAGLGNGNWSVISSIIDQAMGDTEVVCWLQ